MEQIKEFFWRIKRNLKYSVRKKEKEKKRFLCRIGIHKIRRGFGWADPKRMDICLCCKYSKWYNDPIGNKILKENLSYG